MNFIRFEVSGLNLYVATLLHDNVFGIKKEVDFQNSALNRFIITDDA